MFRLINFTVGVFIAYFFTTSDSLPWRLFSTFSLALESRNRKESIIQDDWKKSLTINRDNDNIVHAENQQQRWCIMCIYVYNSHEGKH